MIAKSKIAGALAALTLAASLALPTAEAQAKPKWGIAATIVGSAIVAGAIANSYAYPAYYGGYHRCRWVRQYNEFGFYVGRERVCYYVD